MNDIFSDETEIYKYINHAYIRSLLEDKKLFFCQIEKWPDMTEGFLDGIVNPENRTLRYGSCWTQHQGVERIVDERQKDKALKAVKLNGIDSMWRTYCPDGGVRIRTTIGKIRAVVEKYCNEAGAVFRDGLVVYEHHADTKQYQIDQLCFSKSPNFYTDDEYRFVIAAKEAAKEGIFVPIENVAHFVDEVLVSPAMLNDPNSLAMSRCIYDYVWNIPNKEFSLAELKDRKVLSRRKSVLYGRWG